MHWGFVFLNQRVWYLYPPELLSWVRIFRIYVTARLARYDFLATAQIMLLDCGDRHARRFDIGTLQRLECGDDLTVESDLWISEIEWSCYK